MFMTLWNILTLQWGKVGLPTDNVFELDKHYSFIVFKTNAYPDVKQAEKAFLKLVGGRGFKKVLSKKAIELLVPPYMYPHVIGPFEYESYREDRFKLLAQVKSGQSVQLFMRKDWIEKVMSQDFLYPDGQRVVRVMGYGCTNSRDFTVLLFKFHMEKDIETLDKHLPENCSECGRSLYALHRRAQCIYCWDQVPEALKIIKKSMGNKVFKLHLLSSDQSTPKSFKELQKKKYRTFLEDASVWENEAVQFRDPPEKAKLRAIIDDEYEMDSEEVDW